MMKRAEMVFQVVVVGLTNVMSIRQVWVFWVRVNSQLEVCQCLLKSDFWYSLKQKNVQ